MRQVLDKAALRRGPGLAGGIVRRVLVRLVAVLAVLITPLALFVTVGRLACAGPPARSKHWRHQPWPTEGIVIAPSAPEHAKDAAAIEQRARTLSIWLPAEPATLNPLDTLDQSGVRVTRDTIFESLIRMEPGSEQAGDHAKYAPGLASAWRVIGDGHELRFSLREGVRFHDGKTFTTVDAQFSIDSVRAGNSRAPHLKALLADVASVEIWGVRDLRIQLRKPNAMVLRALAEVPMVPAGSYWARERAARTRGPIGTGPYMLLGWEPGRRIRLARNPTYWAEAVPIQEVQYVVQPDAAEAIMAAKRGEIDILPELIPEHYPEQTTVPGIVDRFVPLRLRPAWFRALVLNGRRPPFDDARVRQAIARLVDRARIAHEVHDGLARPEALPVWPGGPADGAEAPEPAFDLALAGGLLGEAGWVDPAGKGIREKAGTRLHVAVLAVGEAGEGELAIVVQALKKAGFAVELRVGDPGFLLKKMKDGEFDIALVEWRGLADTDLAALVGTGGAMNWGGFTSPTVDAALSAVKAAWEPAARTAAVAGLVKELSVEWPLVGTIAADPCGLVSTRVKGVTPWNGWISIRSLRLEETP